MLLQSLAFCKTDSIGHYIVRFNKSHSFEKCKNREAREPVADWALNNDCGLNGFTKPRASLFKPN